MFHLIWNFLLLLFFLRWTKVDRKSTGSYSLEFRVQRKVKRYQGQNVPKQVCQNVLNNTLYVLVLGFPFQSIIPFFQSCRDDFVISSFILQNYKIIVDEWAYCETGMT